MIWLVSKEKTLLLIDGSNLAFRMFFALEMSNLRNAAGVPTWAVYGTLKALFDTIEKTQPTAIAVAFDLPQPSFRHELFDDYKANRPDEMPEELKQQWPVIIDLFKHLHIPVLQEPGFEADDLIGIMAHKARQHDYKTVILSGDKDLYQLINPDTTMAVPQRGGGLKIVDEAEVFEQMGVRPDQVPDYKGIAGDSSDNIPGVRGLGPKAASKLLGEYGTLEKIYENIEEVGPPKTKEKLVEQEDNAKLSKHLATILLEEDGIEECDLSLEHCELEVPETDALIQFLKDQEFTSVLKRLPAVLKPFNGGKLVKVDVGDLPEEKPSKSKKQSVAKQVASPSTDDLDTPLEDLKLKGQLISTEKELDDLIAKLEKASTYAIDLETDGLNTFNCNIVGWAFAVKETKDIDAFYIPVEHENEDCLDPEIVLEKLKKIIEDESKTQIVQNSKFEHKIFHQHGIKFHHNFFDTMLASYIENPTNKHGLKAQSKRVFRLRMTEIEELIGTGRKQIPISQAPLTEVCNYAAADAYMTYKLYDYYNENLEKTALKLLAEMEFPLAMTLTEIELNGICLDDNHFAKLSEELKSKIESITQRIHKNAGKEFNIASPAQLSQVLFEEQNIEAPGKKNKSGNYSTDIGTLETLLNDYNLDKERKQLVQDVIEFRSLSKLSSTYVETLPKLVSKETGRLHTDFNQVVTSTGRLSSSNPNLQNIPIRDSYGKEIRRGFIAKDSDHQLISADYSQIELRLLAHMADEKNLIDAFSKGEDIHKRTAQAVLGKEEINEDDRRLGKTLNFALVYMQGPFATAKQLGISMSEARDFIKKYFAAFPSIQPFMHETLEFAHENMYVETMFGHRRYFKNINSPNKILQKEEERQAFNTPLQGTAAEIMKIAMINLAKKLKEKYKAKILLQVHDELIIECPKAELEEVSQLTQKTMETAADLSVPLLVDIASGQNWLEAK